MDAADLAGRWAFRDAVLTLGRGFDPRGFELRGRGRGYVAGGWLAVEGQFIAEVTECSSPGPGGEFDSATPDWLTAACRIEGRGIRAVLRDVRGKVTARLTRLGQRAPATPAPVLIDVTFWPGAASRAGLDGGVLVLVDAAGVEVGRLERA